jgi:low temperature requirement protein LtrA
MSPPLTTDRQARYAPPVRWSIRRTGHLPRLSAELRQRESVKPLELFFDLVFVLGFTQCTALMVADPHWEGIARGLLVLAMLWWAWSAYAWLTSVVDPEEGPVRVAMFGVMAGLLVVALCVPEAFGDRALPFAIAYGVIRAGHIVLFLLASRDDPALRRSVLSLSITSAICIGLLVVAASLDGYAQGMMWVLAILLDWGGPALFGMTGWRLVPAHFAERFNLVIILALGESIVVLGVAVHVDLTAGVYVAAVLGVALASAIWWTYFDVVALVTERRLVRATPGRERNLLARDSYSYLHFPMVAGIVLVAFGLEQTLAHVDEHLHTVPAFALYGGIALYLLAHVALRLRNAHTVNWQRLVLAIVLLAIWPAAVEVDALVALAAVNLLFWAMIAYEFSTYDQRRYDLRHGVEFDPPTRDPH